MSSEDTVVFLESDWIGTGELFFECTRRLGIRPILLSSKAHSYRNLAEFDRLKIAEMNETAVVDAIDSLGRDRVRGLWALRDSLTALAARVSMAIGRPGLDPAVVETCCDKYRTREHLLAAGVNDVQFALARSGEEAANVAAVFGGRVVIKPRFLTGSVGVRLCCSSEETRCHFNYLSEKFPEVLNSGVLIEAAVEGRQFSVQIFDGRSIGVTRQDVGPPPAFITVGLDFPWSDDLRVHGEIVEHAERAVAAVGHSRGPGSVDIKYGAQGPCIIEINPRLAGDMIPENIRLALGIDIIACTIRFACGMPYEVKPRYHRASATRWLLRPGMPVSVAGREKAENVSGVMHVRTFPNSYGRKGPARDFRDRLAFVMAEAASSPRAAEIAELSLGEFKAIPEPRPKSRRPGWLISKSIRSILRRVNFLRYFDSDFVVRAKIRFRRSDAAH
jgi:biotin carboxylase